MNPYDPPLTDEDLEPNNISDFTPSVMTLDEHAYEAMEADYDEDQRMAKEEPMIRCGNCHPEFLPAGIGPLYKELSV